jgi:tRNA(Ile)-lysidine synthase
MAELFRGEEEFWETYLARKFAGVVRSRRKETLVLDVPALLSQPLPLRLRCLRRAIEKIQGHLRRISLPHIWAINDLLESSDPNRTLKLPQGLTVTRAYKGLHLSRSGEVAVIFEHPVPGPGYVEIAEIGRAMRFEIQSRKGRVLFDPSPRVALLDFDDLEFPLTLRSFRPGDRFQPLGMEGEKKVKDLFIDRKVPAVQRKRIPLLCRGERILWVAGIHMDHRVRLKAGTRRILRAELI